MLDDFYFIGFENNKEYVIIAENRLKPYLEQKKEEKKQKKLKVELIYKEGKN